MLEEVGHCRQTLQFYSGDFLLLVHFVLPDFVSKKSSCLVGLPMKSGHGNCLDCSASRTPVNSFPPWRKARTVLSPLNSFVLARRQGGQKGGLLFLYLFSTDECSDLEVTPKGVARTLVQALTLSDEQLWNQRAGLLWRKWSYFYSPITTYLLNDFRVLTFFF